MGSFRCNAERLKLLNDNGHFGIKMVGPLEIGYGGIHVAQCLFRHTAPVKAFFERRPAQHGAQSRISQVDYILVTDRIVVGPVRTGLVPHHSVRPVFLRDRERRVKCKGLVISDCRIIVLHQLHVAGALVEPGKIQVETAQRLGLLVRNSQRVLVGPLGITPRADDIKYLRLVLGRIDQDEEIIECAPA